MMSEGNDKLNEEVKKAAKVVMSGGTILYPTDTIWGIGCNATRPKAVKKVFRLKRRDESKSLIILVDTPERIRHYSSFFSDMIYDLMQSFDKPTTIIFPGAKNLAKNVIAKDGTVAIRVAKHAFCQKLIATLNRPIVSTSANIAGEEAPSVFPQITQNIREGVDYVVEWEQNVMREVKPSTILKIKNNGMYEVIRS